VTEAALAGSHIAAVPLKVQAQMIHHPVTDSGIVRFREDWEVAQAGTSATSDSREEPSHV
jgi:transaldolase